MRTILTLALLLAIPTFAAAQQQADPVDMATPTIQLEQSTPASSTMAPAASADAPAADVEVEARTTAPADDAAEMQEPGSRNWWWIVGAVVVGGLIVVLIS